MLFESFVYLMTSSDTCSNLAFEEWLFDNLEPEQRIFLVYENLPSVVIGKNQNAWIEANHDFLNKNNVVLLRRISGGGTVVHGGGNINYSFIVPRQSFNQNENLVFLQKYFDSLSLATTRSDRGDLLLGDKKFSGNAMAYRQKSVLHHGTLLFNLEPDFLSQCLKRPVASTWLQKSSSVKSNPMPTTNLANHLHFTKQIDFAQDLAEWVSRQWGVTLQKLDTSMQYEKTGEYRKKYTDWHWNFGHSPNFYIADPEPASRKVSIEIENGMMVKRINSDGSHEELKPLSFVGFDNEDALRSLVDY